VLLVFVLSSVSVHAYNIQLKFMCIVECGVHGLGVLVAVCLCSHERKREEVEAVLALAVGDARGMKKFKILNQLYHSVQHCYVRE
jgi:hypothetical protein